MKMLILASLMFALIGCDKEKDEKRPAPKPTPIVVKPAPVPTPVPVPVPVPKPVPAKYSCQVTNKVVVKYTTLKALKLGIRKYDEHGCIKLDDKQILMGFGPCLKCVTL